MEGLQKAEEMDKIAHPNGIARIAGDTPSVHGAAGQGDFAGLARRGHASVGMGLADGGSGFEYPCHRRAPLFAVPSA